MTFHLAYLTWCVLDRSYHIDTMHSEHNQLNGGENKIVKYFEKGLSADLWLWWTYLCTEWNKQAMPIWGSADRSKSVSIF